MTTQKLIQLRVPLALYEEFYRAFPDRGEGTRMIKLLMEVAIEIAQEENTLKKRIKEKWGGA